MFPETSSKYIFCYPRLALPERHFLSIVYSHYMTHTTAEQTFNIPKTKTDKINTQVLNEENEMNEC